MKELRASGAFRLRTDSASTSRRRVETAQKAMRIEATAHCYFYSGMAGGKEENHKRIRGGRTPTPSLGGPALVPRKTRRLTAVFRPSRFQTGNGCVLSTLI